MRVLRVKTALLLACVAVAGATARYELEWVVGSVTSRVSVVGTSHVLAVSGETSLSVAGVDMNGVGPFSPSIFALPIVGLPYQPAFDQFGESARYSYGFVVATGDFDADGIDDVVIGAPFSGPNDGSVHTLTGSTSGLAPGNSRIFPTSESSFGFSLATVFVTRHSASRPWRGCRGAEPAGTG